MSVCHLYRHYADDGELLYVGISLSALQRLREHREHSEWFNKIVRVDIQSCETREAAIEAERKAIMEEKPTHNVQHSTRAALKVVADGMHGWRIERDGAFRIFHPPGSSTLIVVHDESPDPRARQNLRNCLRRFGASEAVWNSL